MDTINSGDTAFILVSAALVMFMTPGLALFYGGMVRSKNVLATIMQSFIIIGLVSIVWAVVGYTLAFGPDIGGVIGGLDHLGLAGVGQEPGPYADNIPGLVFVIFQGMFAVITPALITGAFAERIKFSSFLVFTALWAVLVYSPTAHWVWGGGWIGELGALDFAGGTVVHISSAAAALAAVLVIGRRRGFGADLMHPHNVPMTVLGAGILWFGWFGFNAGSALAADGLAANAFVVTHLAAAAAALSWAGAEWVRQGNPTTLGAASGAVAGLVAITPAAGFVGPMAAIVIGLLAGGICYGAVLLKWRLKYDDSLDVVGVHGAGGTLGAVLTGVFATTAVNAGAADGLLYGNAALLGKQLIGIGAVVAWSFVMTYGILRLVKAVMGVRVDEEQEELGLDLSQHAETGYTLGAVGGSAVSGHTPVEGAPVRREAHPAPSA